MNAAYRPTPTSPSYVSGVGFHSSAHQPPTVIHETTYVNNNDGLLTGLIVGETLADSREHEYREERYERPDYLVPSGGDSGDVTFGGYSQQSSDSGDVSFDSSSDSSLGSDSGDSSF